MMARLVSSDVDLGEEKIGIFGKRDGDLGYWEACFANFLAWYCSRFFVAVDEHLRSGIWGAVHFYFLLQGGLRGSSMRNDVSCKLLVSI